MGVFTPWKLANAIYISQGIFPLWRASLQHTTACVCHCVEASSAHISVRWVGSAIPGERQGNNPQHMGGTFNSKQLLATSSHATLTTAL